MRDHEARPESDGISAEMLSGMIDSEGERKLRISSLIEGAESLVEELRYQRPPDFSRTMFELYETDLHDVYVPEIVQTRQLMKYLDSVQITQVISPEDPSSPATIINFEFTTIPPDIDECSPEEQAVYHAIAERSTISTRLNQINQHNSDIQASEFTVDDPEELETTIPNSEIRKCIFSILAPKDEPPVGGISPLMPELHNIITQEMKKIASWHLAEEAYTLTDEAGEEIGYVHMIWSDSILSEVNIYKILDTQLAVSEKGDIIDQQRALAANIVTAPNKLDVETYYTQGPIGSVGRSEEAIDEPSLHDAEDQRRAFEEEQQAMTILLEFMQQLTDELSGSVSFEPISEDAMNRARNTNRLNQDDD